MEQASRGLLALVGEILGVRRSPLWRARLVVAVGRRPITDRLTRTDQGGAGGGEYGALTADPAGASVQDRYADRGVGGEPLSGDKPAFPSGASPRAKSSGDRDGLRSLCMVAQRPNGPQVAGCARSSRFSRLHRGEAPGNRCSQLAEIDVAPVDRDPVEHHTVDQQSLQLRRRRRGQAVAQLPCLTGYRLLRRQARACRQRQQRLLGVLDQIAEQRVSSGFSSKAFFNSGSTLRSPWLAFSSRVCSSAG